MFSSPKLRKGQANGWRYWQVRELAGKSQSDESAVGAESPKVWAKPALVQCTRCWAGFAFQNLFDNLKPLSSRTLLSKYRLLYTLRNNFSRLYRLIYFNQISIWVTEVSGADTPISMVGRLNFKLNTFCL